MDGKTLAKLLLAKDYMVVLTYRRTTLTDEKSFRQEFQPHSTVGFELCDITDQNSVRECLTTILNRYGRIDELYLLAAFSHVGASFNQKELCIATNGQSYFYFLEFLRLNSRETRVYGAMTSELAGNVPDGFVFDEDSCWNPKSPYSIGKALGAHWIRFYRESTDSEMFCCFGILFNHSNCYRSKDFFIRKITNGFARIALGKEKHISIGHLDFARDEHWSDFGCEMMWKMLQQDSPRDFVIGNGETHSGEEYITLAANYFNLKWEDHISYDKKFLRPNEVKRLISDPSKAEKFLGWKRNRISFQKHIELMCQFDYELESGKTPTHPVVF